MCPCGQFGEEVNSADVDLYGGRFNLEIGIGKSNEAQG